MNIEQYEAGLEGVHCDLQRISLLERESRARLQIVHRHSNYYIHSISDKYTQARVLILSLALHVYRHRDQHLLSLLKSIVYQSELHLLTASHGLLKEELHKNVGAHLDQILQAHDLQNELVRCFNCVAFFDEVMVCSFGEFLRTNDFSSLPSWQAAIANSFQIQVCIMQRQHLASSLNPCPPKDQDCIYLQMEGNSLYIPSNYRHSVQTDRVSERSVVSIQSIQVSPLCHNNVLTVSIEDHEYPSTDKENINHINTRTQPQKISDFSCTPKVIQRSRRKKQSLWSLLCCGTD